MSEPLPKRREPPSAGRAEPLAEPSFANPTYARGLRVAALMATDFASLCASGAAAYLLWALPMRHQSPDMYLRLLPLLTLFIVGFAAAGLYPGFGLGPVETLRGLSLVSSFGLPHPGRHHLRPQAPQPLLPRHFRHRLRPGPARRAPGARAGRERRRAGRAGGGSRWRWSPRSRTPRS